MNRDHHSSCLGNASTPLSGNLFRQGSLEEVARTIQKMTLVDLIQTLPELQVNQRVLVFLLLNEATAIRLFQQLSLADKTTILQAMDPVERNWLLESLTYSPKACSYASQ